MEIPLPTLNYAVKLCAGYKKKVILNPAPAQPMPDELLASLYCITPNETEAQLLTGIEVTDVQSADKAARILKKKGIQLVNITLGAKGAFVLSDKLSTLIPAPVVQPIDTTAAGDVFNGALAVATAEGFSVIEAVEFANSAAAVSVTRLGAQSSVPFRKEITMK